MTNIDKEVKRLRKKPNSYDFFTKTQQDCILTKELRKKEKKKKIK